MKTLSLAAGLTLATLFAALLVMPSERVTAATPPDQSAAPVSTGPAAASSSRIAQVGTTRCTRLWRRCARGNQRACGLYRVECRLIRPIY